MQKEILSLFLEQGISGVKDVTRAHYEALYEKIAEKGNGTFSLPGGYFVVCDYEHFRLTKNKPKKQENICVECDMASGNIVEMDGVYYRFRFEVVAREKLDSEIPQKDYTKWFDYDKINSKLTIRNPRPGDFFVLDDKGHKKKLYGRKDCERASGQAACTGGWLPRDLGGSKSNQRSLQNKSKYKICFGCDQRKDTS